MLKAGDKAPPFALPSNEGRTVRLGDLRGKPVVLYFYPKDDTPGCTKEACSFRDAWSEIQETGAVVLGVSPDDAASHEKFRAKYRLPFPLLSDPDHAVADAYGAWGEKSMYGKKYMGIVRSAFVVDEQGKIAAAFYKISPKDTVPKVTAALKS
jgi:thioredoxin-dependent peroxiredoxin